jgi:hypothetical protein
MTQLVHDMVSSVYEMYRSETTVRRFAWSLSCEQLPNLVYNFIRTQDCFIHTSGGPYLQFDVVGSYTGGSLLVYVDIHWQAPRITFSALSTRLSEGEKYHITPHYSDATVSRASSDGFSLIKDEITYSLSKSPLALQWDHWLECFRGPVQYDVEASQLRGFYNGHLLTYISRVMVVCSKPSCQPKSQRRFMLVYISNESLGIASSLK